MAWNLAGVLRAIIQRGAAAPAPPADGLLWLDTSSGGAVRTAPLRAQMQRMWVYGDSGAIIPGVKCTPGNEWMNLLAARMGTDGRPITYAVGGSDAIGISYHMVNGSTGGLGLPAAVPFSKWDPNRRGPVFIHTGVNDATGQNDRTIQHTPVATDADHQNGMTGALRACIAIASSASRLEVENATLTGTGWVVNNNALFSNGTSRYTTNPGDHVDFTNVPFPATGPLAGKVHLIMHSLSPASFTVPTVDIYVDGALVKTLTPAQQRMRPQKTSGTATITYAPMAVEIDAAPGNHTVTVTMRTAGLLSLDFIAIPSATPPPIFVPKEWNPIYNPVAGGWNQADIDIITANKAVLDPLYQAVVAEFPNACWVPYVSFNTATMLGNDGLHPQDRGMISMTNDWFPAVQDFLATYDSDNLYNSLVTATNPLSNNIAVVQVWQAASGVDSVVTMDSMICISGGTVSAISIDGVPTGLTSGAFIVKVGHRISCTYTVAPNFSQFDITGI